MRIERTQLEPQQRLYKVPSSLTRAGRHSASEHVQGRSRLSQPSRPRRAHVRGRLYDARHGRQRNADLVQTERRDVRPSNSCTPNVRCRWTYSQISPVRISACCRVSFLTTPNKRTQRPSLRARTAPLHVFCYSLNEDMRTLVVARVRFCFREPYRRDGFWRDRE